MVPTISIPKDLVELFLLRNTDTLSFQEIIEARGRTAYTEKQNRQWLSAKLSGWNKHSFVKAVYKPRGHRGRPSVAKLQLTEEGKKTLAMFRGNPRTLTKPHYVHKPDPETNNNSPAISLADVLQVVSDLSPLYPDLQMTIEIKLKEGVVTIRWNNRNNKEYRDAITPTSEVRLKQSPYRSIADLAGAAGTLPQPISDKEMIRIAHEDHADEVMKHM